MGKKTDKMDKNGLGYEWEYARTKDTRTTWQKIKNGIYNPTTHAFLGRTAQSWGGVLLFYAIFYGALALFFGLLMEVLKSTLDDKTPRWTLEESIIGTNPGLGYRPMPDNLDQSALIYYKADNKTNVKIWKDEIDKFLQTYTNENITNRVPCDGNPIAAGKVCEFHLHKLGECSPKVNPDYGYTARTPCVFIKLNKIMMWTPDYYKSISELPQLPNPNLLNYITNLTNEGNTSALNAVWVTCDGESPSDRENIGPITLYPEPGYFPGYYFPYRNDENYLSPLVAIHFKSPRKNVAINIECRAWSKNIIYRKNALQREGSVHFEIFVD